MDLANNDQQRMLRDMVEKPMRKVATPEYLRRLDSERLYPYELYDAWVEAGLLSLPFPEEYGGAGASVVDLVIVSEALGQWSADLVMAFGGSVLPAIRFRWI